MNWNALHTQLEHGIGSRDRIPINQLVALGGLLQQRGCYFPVLQNNYNYTLPDKKYYSPNDAEHFYLFSSNV